MPDNAEVARRARLKVLDLIYRAQASHIGSNFSCIDILTAVFARFNFDTDRFVLSKGWAAASLYYFLWLHGRITEEQLDSYCQPGSQFIGLAEPVIPEIPIAGGSMGLGLPGAVGLALAKKIKGESGLVYVLMSDGEIQCGTTWESVLIAAQHRLDNLVVLVDQNGLQAMGETNDILGAGFPLLGWRGSVCSGHSYEEIGGYLSLKSETPRVVSCHTIKGRGVSFMENNNLYHYKQLSEDEYGRACTELQHG